MQVHWRFSKDAIVEVCGEGIERLPQFKLLIGKKLYIDGARWYQSTHYREDATTDCYCVAPIESNGYEHDDYTWIGGCNLRLVDGGTTA